LDRQRVLALIFWAPFARNKEKPRSGLVRLGHKIDLLSHAIPPLPAALVCRSNAELFHRA
jgi:hypothetical protein